MGCSAAETGGAARSVTSSAWPRRAMLAAALLLGSGCEQGVEVRVDQAAGGVGFTLIARSGDFRPCLGTLALYPDDPAGAPRLWYISNGKASEPCVTSLRYGDSPPGFGPSPPAPPLVPGKSYRVEVSGNAFVGNARFTRQ